MLKSNEITQEEFDALKKSIIATKEESSSEPSEMLAGIKEIDEEIVVNNDSEGKTQVEEPVPNQNISPNYESTATKDNGWLILAVLAVISVIVVFIISFTSKPEDVVKDWVDKNINSLASSSTYIEGQSSSPIYRLLSSRAVIKAADDSIKNAAYTINYVETKMNSGTADITVSFNFFKPELSYGRYNIYNDFIISDGSNLLANYISSSGGKYNKGITLFLKKCGLQWCVDESRVSDFYKMFPFNEIESGFRESTNNYDFNFTSASAVRLIINSYGWNYSNESSYSEVALKLNNGFMTYDEFMAEVVSSSKKYYPCIADRIGPTSEGNPTIFLDSYVKTAERIYGYDVTWSDDVVYKFFCR
jgi:hypothetical protein